MSALAATFAVVVAAGPVGAQATLEPAPETVDAFHAALQAGDRRAALALLDEAVVIFESGGAELSRDEYASHHLDGDMAFTRAVKTQQVDRRDGSDGDVAWVLTRSQATGTWRDRPINVRGTETMLLRRTDSGWHIVHIHWSSRDAGP